MGLAGRTGRKAPENPRRCPAGVFGVSPPRRLLLGDEASLGDGLANVGAHVQLTVGQCLYGTVNMVRNAKPAVLGLMDGFAAPQKSACEQNAKVVAACSDETPQVRDALHCFLLCCCHGRFSCDSPRPQSTSSRPWPVTPSYSRGQHGARPRWRLHTVSTAHHTGSV